MTHKTDNDADALPGGGAYARASGSGRSTGSSLRMNSKQKGKSIESGFAQANWASSRMRSAVIRPSAAEFSRAASTN